MDAPPTSPTTLPRANMATRLLATLAVIAASPFTQTPALILAALLALPWPEVLAALLLGKGLKYSVVGAVTAHSATVPPGLERSARNGNDIPR